jgi:hypothetical protein
MAKSEKPKVYVMNSYSDLAVVMNVISGLRRNKCGKKDMDKFFTEVAIAGQGKPLLGVLQKWVELEILDDNKEN